MYYLDGIVKEEKENDVFLRVPKRSQQLDCLDQATPNENWCTIVEEDQEKQLNNWCYQLRLNLFPEGIKEVKKKLFPS